MLGDSVRTNDVDLEVRVARARRRVHRFSNFLELLTILQIAALVLVAHWLVPPPPAPQTLGPYLFLLWIVVTTLEIPWFLMQRKKIFRSEDACCAKCLRPLSPVALRRGHCVGCGTPLVGTGGEDRSLESVGTVAGNKDLLVLFVSAAALFGMVASIIALIWLGRRLRPGVDVEGWGFLLMSCPVVLASTWAIAYGVYLLLRKKWG